MLNNRNLEQRESFRKLFNKMIVNVLISNVKKWNLQTKLTFLRGFSAKHSISVWHMFQVCFQATIHFTQWIWIEWIATSRIIFTIALIALDSGCCYVHTIRNSLLIDSSSSIHKVKFWFMEYLNFVLMKLQNNFKWTNVLDKLHRLCLKLKLLSIHL